MKRFLVKVTSVATNDNPSFAGHVHTYLFGKGQRMLRKESNLKDTYLADFSYDWEIPEYGYARECDAKRSWHYRNLNYEKFWTSTAEIVEVEC